MNKVKLSPKESLVKSLERKFSNLQKKLRSLTANYLADKKEIKQEMELVAIQLNALKKK